MILAIVTSIHVSIYDGRINISNFYWVTVYIISAAQRKSEVPFKSYTRKCKLYFLALNNLKNSRFKTNLSHSSALKGRTSIPWEQNTACPETRCGRRTRERSLPTGSTFSWVTSFHLRLGKQGGSQRARPSARGSWLGSCWLGPLLATAWETKHAGRPHPCEHRTTTPPPAAARSLPTAWGPSRPRAGTNGRLSQYLRGKAPPCGVAPAAPSGPAASYCDLSPSQWPARQLPCPRASSPPEPGLRPRRCHGASFLSVPLHGWGVPGNDSCTPGADSQLTPRGLHALHPRALTVRLLPRPLHPTAGLEDQLPERRRTTLRCARRRRPPRTRPRDAQHTDLPLLGSRSPLPRPLLRTNLAGQGARKTDKQTLRLFPPQLSTSPLCFHPEGEGAGLRATQTSSGNRPRTTPLRNRAPAQPRPRGPVSAHLPRFSIRTLPK